MPIPAYYGQILNNLNQRNRRLVEILEQSRQKAPQPKGLTNEEQAKRRMYKGIV